MTGIELLQQTGDVETAYNLTPEQLEEKIATADALIIRSATQAWHASQSQNPCTCIACVHVTLQELSMG